MIRFQCPKCGMQYEVEDKFAGVHAVCEQCKIKLLIPSKGNGEERLVARAIIEPACPKSADPGMSTERTVLVIDEPAAIATPRIAPVARPAATPKLSPRQRRLTADLKKLLECFASFPTIQIKSYAGNPPERYVIAYNVKGIERVDGDRIVYRNYHEVEIKLPGTYPRTPPLCRMLTPIFHPNIEPAVICIGDHWTAAERLCDLIVRIGEMIAYQAHNIKSPLDGEAAMWTDLHMDMLPIDSSDLTPPDL